MSTNSQVALKRVLSLVLIRQRWSWTEEQGSSLYFLFSFQASGDCMGKNGIRSLPHKINT